MNVCFPKHLSIFPKLLRMFSQTLASPHPPGHYSPKQWLNYLNNVTYTSNSSTTPGGKFLNNSNFIYSWNISQHSTRRRSKLRSIVHHEQSIVIAKKSMVNGNNNNEKRQMQRKRRQEELNKYGKHSGYEIKKSRRPNYNLGLPSPKVAISRSNR